MFVELFPQRNSKCAEYAYYSIHIDFENICEVLLH